MRNAYKHFRLKWECGNPLDSIKSDVFVMHNVNICPEEIIYWDVARIHRTYNRAQRPGLVDTAIIYIDLQIMRNYLIT
jgi:hypothetical protein